MTGHVRARGAGRCAAVDVGYGAAPAAAGAVPVARAAVVVAPDARFATIVAEHTVDVTGVAPYRPGAFFERELPALRAVLARAGRLDLVVVDGYVDLDPDGRPGLGAYLHGDLGVPVIGVAKTLFRPATHAARVYRAGTGRPLYVTAAGLEIADAARVVERMAGPYRLPDALRRVDALSRGAPATRA